MEKEDTKRNYIEFLKDCLKDREIKKTADCLLEMYNQDEKKFKKSLMLGGILPEPSSFDLNKNIYKFEVFKEACKLMIEELKEQKNKVKFDFIRQVMIIITGYEVLINHNISNERRCNKCDFINYDKAKQLQMWCIFIEDQMRLASSNVDSKVNENGVYTGIESMTPMNIDGNELYKLSSSDLIESSMELVEEIFRFIFYINRKTIKEYVDVSCVDSYPYMVPCFKEIIHLTSHRVMLKKTWELFKYRNWTLRIDENNTKEIYCFKPQNTEKFIKESAAIQREGYNALQKSLKAVFLWKMFNNNLKSILEKISGVELSNVFTINSEHLKTLMKFYTNIIKSQMSFTLKFYGEDLWKVKVKDSINIEMIFDTMNYLYSIANIYIIKSHESIDFDNKDDYYKLAPIISKSKLAKQLSNILEIGEEIALKCIDIFTFKPVLKEKQISLDIFSQPLVYVSEEQVIFTPCFVMQMNAERIIDKVLGAIDYNLSDKGHTMEKTVNELIDQNEYIDVNKNTIKFTAFDGKDVEFDCIAVFQGKLIIMEMKCRTTPYSNKEKNDKEVVLYEAVGQVKRRVQVVQHNWEDIKKRSSIKLMENPPKENDIIKIACFNFFNFTGQVVDGVYITDYSAITKYFNNPIEYANISRKNSIEKIPVKNIWKGKKPTIENLLKFLEMPSMMEGFYDNIKLIYKPIIRIEEENVNLGVIDYYLEKNPYEKYFNLLKASNTVKRTKSSKKNIKNKQSKASRKLNRRK